MDGDGDIDDEDRAIGAQLKEMDVNGDGYVTLKELVGIGKAQLAEDNKKGMLRRAILVMLLMVVLACGAMLGVGVAAAEVAKEAKPNDDSGELRTTRAGALVQMGTASRTYNETTVITLAPQELRKADEMLVIQEDGTRSFYKVTGWDKLASGDLHLFTPSPEKVIVYAASKKVRLAREPAPKDRGKFRSLPRLERIAQTSAFSSFFSFPVGCWPA